MDAKTMAYWASRAKIEIDNLKEAKDPGHAWFLDPAELEAAMIQTVGMLRELRTTLTDTAQGAVVAQLPDTDPSVF